MPYVTALTLSRLFKPQERAAAALALPRPVGP